VSYLFPPWAVDDDPAAGGGGGGGCGAARWFHTQSREAPSESPRIAYDVLHVVPVLPAAALSWMKKPGATMTFEVRAPRVHRRW
jgi:hypothetical protein